MTISEDDPQQEPVDILQLDPERSASQAILERILMLDLTPCQLAVCLAAKQTDAPKPRLLRMDMSQRAADDFRAGVEQALASARKALERKDLRVRAFEPDSALEEDTIEYLNIASYESLQAQLVDLRSYPDLDNLRGYEHPFVDDLRFSCVVIDPPSGFQEPIYYYRWYSHTSMLSDAPQHALRWPFGSQQGTYDVIEEPVFLFDRHVDCLSYGGQMFILQKYNFFTIFDLEEELKKTAEKALAELERMDFIHNFPQFKHDCLRNKNKYRILSKIYLKPYFLNLNVDDLENAINEYTLPIKVQLVGQQRQKKLLYSASDPWAILHLLDDQFFTSSLTNLDYQARGKNQLRQSASRVRPIASKRRGRP